MRPACLPTDDLYQSVRRTAQALRSAIVATAVRSRSCLNSSDIFLACLLATYRSWNLIDRSSYASSHNAHLGL